MTPMKNSKISNFTNLLIIYIIICYFAKIYGVGQIMANQQLFKDTLINISMW